MLLPFVNSVYNFPTISSFLILFYILHTHSCILFLHRPFCCCLFFLFKYLNNCYSIQLNSRVFCVFIYCYSNIWTISVQSNWITAVQSDWKTMYFACLFLLFKYLNDCYSIQLNNCYSIGLNNRALLHVYLLLLKYLDNCCSIQLNNCYSIRLKICVPFLLFNRIEQPIFFPF